MKIKKITISKNSILSDLIKPVILLRNIEMIFRNQSGQAGIIVILLGVVILTIGLSVVSRSITDVRFSTQEEETTRAFNAAEAGIEDALRQDLSDIVAAGGTGSVNVGGVNVDYQVQESSDLEVDLYEGESVEMPLIPSDKPNKVNIRWGRPDEKCPTDVGYDPDYQIAALVVTVFRTDGTLRRFGFEARNCDRGNNFLNLPSEIKPAGGGSGYMWKTEHIQILVADDGSWEDYALRVRVIYGPNPALRKTQVMISGVGNTLPTQFYTIHSEAQMPGGETRAIEVKKTVEGPPSIFDFAIFSGGSITHN